MFTSLDWPGGAATGALELAPGVLERMRERFGPEWSLAEEQGTAENGGTQCVYNWNDIVPGSDPEISYWDILDESQQEAAVLRATTHPQIDSGSGLYELPITVEIYHY